MGISGAVAGEIRSHAAGGGRDSCTRSRRPTMLWRWMRPPARFSGLTRTRRRRDARPCCGRVNRGLAILGDTLFMGTIDAHLIAIDAKNGRAVWNVTVAEPGSRLRDDARSAGDQRQSDRRHGRRRIRHPRLYRGLTTHDRQGSLALLHHSRPGRAGQRNLGRRFVEARRRVGVGDRLLRSRLSI